MTELSTTSGKGPARGYSWEPFTPGHTKSLKHGARSERVIAPLASTIGNETLEANPHLQAPEFRPMVLEWARVQAQVEVLEEWTAEHGLFKEDGNPTGAADYLLRVRKHATNLASRLGLDPLSRARLGRDVAATQVDVAKLLTEQREAAAKATIEGETA